MKTNHTGKLNSRLFKNTEAYACPPNTDCTGHAWALFRQSVTWKSADGTIFIGEI